MTQILVGTGTGPRTVTVTQGNYAISSDPDVTLSTVLGSCVSVCLFDAEVGIGGMNHFLLPGQQGTAGTQRYGVHLMELLINGLLKGGAVKRRLSAKLFGGSRMSDNLQDIGRKNIDFARDFLLREAIPVLGEHVGGRGARRLRFVPATGAAQQLLVSGNLEIRERVEAAPRLVSDITLF